MKFLLKFLWFYTKFVKNISKILFMSYRNILKIFSIFFKFSLKFINSILHDSRGKYVIPELWNLRGEAKPIP